MTMEDLDLPATSVSPAIKVRSGQSPPGLAANGHGNRNVQKVRIRWGDCDPAGIIFNPRLFEIFDESTAALFEAALGMTKREMLDAYNSAGIAIVRTTATFHAPMRYGDDVAVESTINFGRSSFNVEHRVHLGDRLCAEGAETRVWIVRDETGALKGSPIPAGVLDMFRAIGQQQPGAGSR
jgi:4-hydroxybenzoyl-CoA thioesterase